MSRSGYTDDNDDPLAHGRWRQAVKRALEGKRGFLAHFLSFVLMLSSIAFVWYTRGVFYLPSSPLSLFLGCAVGAWAGLIASIAAIIVIAIALYPLENED